MDITTIAFLVLLGGTNAEHVIEMSNLDDCQRAAEFVSQSQCLSPDEFDTHLRETSSLQMDIKPASGDMAPQKSALENMPAATQRRIRNVLYPQPHVAPTIRPGARKG